MVSFWALTTVVKLLWKFLTLIIIKSPAALGYVHFNVPWTGPIKWTGPARQWVSWATVMQWCHWLQVERGTTATFLSSGGGNAAAFSRLVIIRRKTDQLLRALSRWPTTSTGLLVSGNALHRRSVSSLFHAQLQSIHFILYFIWWYTMSQKLFHIFQNPSKMNHF